jgi:glucokinase
VDLGGTNLRIAAIADTGRLIEKLSLAVRSLANRDAVIEELCRSVSELAVRHSREGSFAGVGTGIPGILYFESGRLRRSPNLPGWEDFPVRDAIQSRLGVSVILDNDANAAALGEQWLGAGREVASLCLLTLGTGVGGGLVFDGKIWRGFLGMAGEVGHIAVAESGIRCGCGSTGCLETEASATAILRKAESLLAAGRSPALAEAIKGAGKLTAELVYQTAQGGDLDCRDIFEQFGIYLGVGLAALVNTLNLSLYVIGGGVSAAWPLFWPTMLSELQRRSYIFAEGSTRVERAMLGGDAGLYGAARLALQSAS